VSERRGHLYCFNAERREKHEPEDHRTPHGGRRYRDQFDRSAAVRKAEALLASTL